MTRRIIYNSEWAKKNISMPNLLRHFGHEPVRLTKQGREYWYISPFRYEKEPSFHTSFVGDKWIWNDFGRGDVQGSGTAIGFLQLHENVDVSRALQILKNLFPSEGREVTNSNLQRLSLFKSISLSEKISNPNSAPQKLKTLEVNEQTRDKALVGYLAGERKINHRHAVNYLHQVKYEIVETGKVYNTLGFQNESGDYECRDKYFKGILKSPISEGRGAVKDISYIPGQDKTKVAVFEGFMDFLTVLTIKNLSVLPIDAVILNMVNMRKRAIDFIKQSEYQTIYTFFDNDSAGGKTTEMFLQEPNLTEKVNPQNHLYKGNKDYNQFWVRS